MSISVKWDADEVGTLGDQLRTIWPRSENNFRRDVRDSTNDLTNRWRKGAIKSSKKHGKLYPYAIEGELTGDGFEGVIGPLSSRPQGDMVFEYGGPSAIGQVNPTGGPYPRPGGGWWGGGRLGQRVGQNKPHLDGNHAADVEFPKFVEKVAETAFRSFW